MTKIVKREDVTNENDITQEMLDSLAKRKIKLMERLGVMYIAKTQYLSLGLALDRIPTKKSDKHLETLDEMIDELKEKFERA